MRRRALSSLVAFTLVAGIPAVAGGAEASGRITGRITAVGGAPLADVCVSTMGALGGGELTGTETGSAAAPPSASAVFRANGSRATIGQREARPSRVRALPALTRPARAKLRVR